MRSKLTDGSSKLLMRHLQDALNLSRKTHFVDSGRDIRAEINPDNFEELKNEVSHKTKVTYHLHDKEYLSLDLHDESQLASFSHTHLEHCSERGSNLDVGHFVIGTSFYFRSKFVIILYYYLKK